MNWKGLMAVLAGLLVLGASGATVHAEKYPTPEASGKIIGYEKITVNGMELHFLLNLR
ncbi:hypothetical protein [Thermococcus sp. JdF3]|uniref:hypothetical protein n=1 Tax=Thermococcus sp. JdF3 TaxID=1638258 RepID=UPI00143946F6|nr:hypothetical protein [Thermococcus sp. JdF3]